MNKKTSWHFIGTATELNRQQEALKSLQVATNNFADEWSGNAAAVQRFNIVMGNGVLSEFNQHPQEWYKYFLLFGYIEKRGGKKLALTSAGHELIEHPQSFNGDHVSVPKNPLLLFHIPSSFSKNSKILFTEDFDIHPVKFLLELVASDDLNGRLTDEEILFFALRAKKDSDLQETIQKIIRFREGKITSRIVFSNKHKLSNEVALLIGFENVIELKKYRKTNINIARQYIRLARLTGMANCDNKARFLAAHKENMRLDPYESMRLHTTS